MSNRIFPFFIALLLLLGVYLGWLLASRQSFSIPVILNVVGIIYSMIAVIVLYETVAQNLTFKTVIVSYIASFLLWAHTVIPLGVAGSWLLMSKGVRLSFFPFIQHDQ